MTPGLLLLSHGDLAASALASARMIVGEIEGAEAVGLRPETPLERLAADVRAALDRIGPGRPVLVLADLFGGSCANVAARLGGGRPTRLLCGLNLAMVVEFALSRTDSDLDALAGRVLEAGRKAVVDVDARRAGRRPPKA
jgi:mannose/fructose-specific phosphotransferase system component IIA